MLELAARRAATIGQIIAAVAPFHAERARVLRAQLADVESLALAVRVSVEVLDACAEVAEKL